MAREKEVRGFNGWLVAFLLLAVMVACVWALATLEDPSAWRIISLAVILTLDGVCFAGFSVVNPNQATVITLFGSRPIQAPALTVYTPPADTGETPVG